MKRVLAFGSLMVATALFAQTVDPRRQLASARTEAGAARQRAAQLEQQAKDARDEAERAQSAQAAIAARLQASEADMSAAEARIVILDRTRRAQEQRLAARQQPIAELVAALQTMARRPAAAALVQPGTVTDLVHVRAVLSTMTPAVAARTRGLRHEVEHARALRTQAGAALASLRAGQRQRALEQQRLTRLEAEQRQRSAQFGGSARIEAERALALGKSARTLEDLVQRLDGEAGLRDRLARLPGPTPRPVRLGEALPSVEVSPERPSGFAYRLPVLGHITRGFGEALPSGARSRGVTVAARPGAIVVAPAGGRVTYAGLYRGYGAIAIVDHGGGYTSLITGLASNFARTGDTVQSGSPLGRAGDLSGVTVELRLDGRPVDLTTLVG